MRRPRAGVKSSMERWQFIRWGIAASVLVHLVIAALIFVSTDVRRFDPPAAEVVAVDIVDPDPPETTPQASPSPSPSPDLALPKPDASSTPAAAPPPSPAAAPQPAASPQPAPPAARDEKPSQPTASAQPQTPAASPSPATTPQAAPSYVPAEPDLTVKYGVMLGLPPPLPPLPQAEAGSKEGDAPAPSASSNLAANLTGAFRQQLKRCSKLPGSVSRSDNIMVRLRVVMTPNGRLAAEPDVIEVTNPIKAVALKQAAVEALMACQPYAMLPPDRYKEWKVLELSFTPQDFVN